MLNREQTTSHSSLVYRLKVRTDLCWRWFFILFVGGLCGASIMFNFYATIELAKPKIRLALVVARKQWFELKIPYMVVTGMGVVLWLGQRCRCRERDASLGSCGCNKQGPSFGTPA